MSTELAPSGDQARPPISAPPFWDCAWEKVQLLVPWVLLAPPAVISQLPAGQSWTERAVTLGLVVAAAGWVFFGNTRVPQALRERGYHVVVYFAGLLVLFTALMSRDMVFLLFTITGFFHAYLLRPWSLGVAGVFGTSVALNTMTLGFPELTAESIATYAGVIAIQTAAIGVGVLFTEKGVEHDRKRDETVKKLEAALEENAGLHAQLLTQAREAGVLDERQRMAREIHDTLAQGLTGIVTQVHAAQQVWDSPERARPHVDRALCLAKDSLAEARRSVQALRPAELDEAYLPEALGDLAKRWAEGTDVDMQVDVTGDAVPLSPAIEVALFRVAQEALTNVANHAHASRVGLTLSYVGDVILLDVRDDGTGMAKGKSRGFGLKSMTQRIRGVGGTLEIESTPGEGTAISA
ncbi:sensor histidine kinase, partial [Phytoactinopolyspora endophytica]|uniref:sensor histidine kinase n=1 Tax=Phytoactinopolyspora endophytica TaxID=1642495 RepID=UPI0013EDDF4D